MEAASSPPTVVREEAALAKLNRVGCALLRETNSENRKKASSTNRSQKNAMSCLYGRRKEVFLSFFSSFFVGCEDGLSLHGWIRKKKTMHAQEADDGTAKFVCIG